MDQIRHGYNNYDDVKKADHGDDEMLMVVVVVVVVACDVISDKTENLSLIHI